MDRRKLLFSLLGAALVTRAIPPASAQSSRIQHDRDRALVEYRRLLDAILSKDVERLRSFALDQITFEKQVIAESDLPAFLDAQTSSNGKPDETPTQIESFERVRNEDGRIIYLANLRRSAWFPEQDWRGVDGGVVPEGFSIQFEFWYVTFEHYRITRLTHWLNLA